MLEPVRHAMSGGPPAGVSARAPRASGWRLPGAGAGPRASVWPARVRAAHGPAPVWLGPCLVARAQGRSGLHEQVRRPVCTSQFVTPCPAGLLPVSARVRHVRVDGGSRELGPARERACGLLACALLTGLHRSGSARASRRARRGGPGDDHSAAGDGIGNRHVLLCRCLAYAPGLSAPPSPAARASLCVLARSRAHCAAAIGGTGAEQGRPGTCARRPASSSLVSA